MLRYVRFFQPDLIDALEYQRNFTLTKFIRMKIRYITEDWKN